MKQSRSEITGIAMIGAGRLARAFIPALQSAGFPVRAIAASTLTSARRACRLAPGAAPASDAAAAAAAADLILMAVPDGVIAPLALRLASSGAMGWHDKIVLHHAGALGPQELAPLERRGAAVGLLHPMQSLGDSPGAVDLLPGSRARIEGVPKARAAARRIADALGLVPLRLRSRLTAEERTIYHAAASMLSNDLIALLDAGSRLLQNLGLGRNAAVEALAPLAKGTLLQAERSGLGAALTGPVVRGDVDTVAAHLRVLRRRSRGGERIHRLLSRQLLCLAEREGMAPSKESVRHLKRLLRPHDGGRKWSRKL
jgi:predicted short-subunit dehydrogenase-like oxidoreductase (DUF2520 family)